MYLGNRKFLKDSLEVANQYIIIANSDEKAANALEGLGLYNQASYFYIQAMEKQIKANIAQIVDVTNTYYRDLIRNTMGHSLDKSLDLLIKIYAKGDAVVAEQLKNQLLTLVLKGVRFSALHNNIRYPNFYEVKKKYSMIEINKSDCDELSKMLPSLKNYLNKMKNRF